MALPFLHKFRSSLAGSKFEHQPQGAERQHAWPLSMLGPDGPEMLSFEIMGIGEPAPRRAGVFIYARKRAGIWQALYIGESSNLSARLAFNEIAADALLSGATDIHILRVDADASERRDLADRLILTNAPPLNEDERVKLAETKSANQKKSTRAA